MGPQRHMHQAWLVVGQCRPAEQLGSHPRAQEHLRSEAEQGRGWFGWERRLMLNSFLTGVAPTPWPGPRLPQTTRGSTAAAPIHSPWGGEARWAVPILLTVALAGTVWRGWGSTLQTRLNGHPWLCPHPRPDRRLKPGQECLGQEDRRTNRLWIGGAQGRPCPCPCQQGSPQQGAGSTTHLLGQSGLQALWEGPWLASPLSLYHVSGP